MPQSDPRNNWEAAVCVCLASEVILWFLHTLLHTNQPCPMWQMETTNNTEWEPLRAGQQRHSYQKFQDTVHVAGNKFLVDHHPCSMPILSYSSDNTNVLILMSIRSRKHLIIILYVSYTQHWLQHSCTHTDCLQNKLKGNTSTWGKSLHL